MEPPNERIRSTPGSTGGAAPVARPLQPTPAAPAAASVGNVDFSPWLGDANLDPYDYLVFSTTAGDNYVVSPLSGNTGLNITSGNSAGVIPPYGLSLATIPGGDTLGFAGNGGTITIDGESGTTMHLLRSRTRRSNSQRRLDGLNGTTINFIGTGMTRNVDAEGTNNYFYIEGAGVSGPSGTLEGDSGTNFFFFLSQYGLEVLGNIEGGGSSTLNYSFLTYPRRVTRGVNVNLGNGTDGTATGVSGSVSGITAVIGSPFNDSPRRRQRAGRGSHGRAGQQCAVRHRSRRQRGGIDRLELYADYHRLRSEGH